MPKTVTASEAKNDVDAIFDWAESHGDEVIVERQGTPRLVIMPYAEFAALAELRERERRRDAWQRLEAIRLRVQERNQDLTEEEADALADRFAREFVEDLIAEGKIHYDLPPE